MSEETRGPLLFIVAWGLLVFIVGAALVVGLLSSGAPASVITTFILTTIAVLLGVMVLRFVFQSHPIEL